MTEIKNGTDKTSKRIFIRKTYGIWPNRTRKRRKHNLDIQQEKGLPDRSTKAINTDNQVSNAEQHEPSSCTQSDSNQSTNPLIIASKSL